MLRYLYGHDLAETPVLKDSMFRDRTGQFSDRLGWEVRVDAQGHERDEYDDLDPLYVIWQRPDGTHGGSMRFMPTTGRTMINEHFARLLPKVPLSDTRIWECTRFCLAAAAPPNVSAALMLGGAEVGRGFGLTHAAGVFDARMVRIYRLLGWPPEILGTEGHGREAISAGLWTFCDLTRDRMAQRAGISAEVSRHWFRMSQAALTAAA